MFIFVCSYICPSCGEGHTGSFWYRSPEELLAWWVFTFGTPFTVLDVDDVTWLDPDGTLNGMFVGVSKHG